MRKGLRIEIEQARSELAAAKAELRIHEARSTERRERGGPLLEVTAEHGEAAGRVFEASQAIRLLRRQLEIEQLHLARKQSAGAAFGTAKIKRKAARRTRKIERVHASLGESADRRGSNKKIAAVAKVSTRTVDRRLAKLRKR